MIRREPLVTPQPKNETVFVGDRFYRVGRWPVTCIVKRVFVPDGHTHLHVLMEREGDGRDPYTITLGGLFDQSNFRPDRRHSGNSYHSGQARRATDLESVN